MLKKMIQMIKQQWKNVLISVVILMLFYTLTLWFSGALIPEQKTVSVVYIPKVCDENDFWKDLIAGAQSAAKEYQVELTILAPEEEKDVEGQKECIRNGIAMKPDVLAVSPSLYAGMTDLIKTAKGEDIPVVLIDSKLDEEIAVSYIGTDNMDAGIKTGEKTLEYLKEDTKIVIMSQSKGASTAMERENGVRIGLGKEEKRIETVLYCESDNEIATELTKQLLLENPGVYCFIGLNLEATIGVAKAIEELGLKDQVTVVGVDFDMRGIQYMEKGIIDAMIIQKPFHMGYLGIKTAAQIARKEKVDSILYSETDIVTIDNLFSQKNEKLLFAY